MTISNIFKSTGIAIAHQLISTLGVLIISGQLVFTFCAVARTWNPSVPAKLASRILTGIPGFPVQAVISLVLGFLLAKFFGRWVMVRIMVWMWVLPLILFGLAVLFPPMHGAPLFAPYARGNSGPTNTFLSVLSYSFPLVAAAAYSLGAKVADRRVHPAQ